jgi:KDO2-lipid IV(A) lauroyltransferase
VAAARRTLWRRLRRKTRGPRNALLARAIYGSARALGALPVPLALAIGRALGAGAYALLGRDRRLAFAHVAAAFPELRPAACAALVQASFRHAGQSFAELALWPRLARRSGWIEVSGREAVEAALAGGCGAIAVTGHVGNWELLAAAMAREYPLTVVARRVNDVRFDALIVRFRRAAGVEILVRDDAHFLSGVRDALGRNRIVALLIDQDTRGAGVWVPFFGRPARTPPGAAVLALRLRVPLLTAFIERQDDGRHRVRIAPVAVPAAGGRGRARDLTALLTAAIEAQIRRAPEQWVWWHERWRRQPDGANSPLLVQKRMVPLAAARD